MNEERYFIEKYNKEYTCLYQIDEYTTDSNTIGKRDRYKCPECYMSTRSKCYICGGDL